MDRLRVHPASILIPNCAFDEPAVYEVQMFVNGDWIASRKLPIVAKGESR